MMIKVIAFDLVGVLVTEKDIELTNEENKLERFIDTHYPDEYMNIIFANKKDVV